MANFKGYQFDYANIQAKNDADLTIIKQGYLNKNPNATNETTGLNWDYNYGTKTLTIYPSKMLLQGRLIELTTTLRYSMPMANGAKYLGVQIDLTQQNTPIGDPTSPNYTFVNNQIVGDGFTPGNDDTGDLFKTSTAFVPVFVYNSGTNTVTLYEYTLPGKVGLFTGMSAVTWDSTNIDPNQWATWNIPGTKGRSFYLRLHAANAQGQNTGQTMVPGLVINGTQGSLAFTGTIRASWLDIDNDINNTSYVARNAQLYYNIYYEQGTDILTIKVRPSGIKTVNWTGKQGENATAYNYGIYMVGAEIMPYYGYLK